ncbi:D-2-hydroxyacid dehydrogenase family protein [Mameliella alba]|uniref:D-isomer specific 2-hydroxyacid dehydrogenase NAD-binding protein n=1 Tax=Mameliella alba TaxID=561184 RepID=A0A0B3SLA3_9RHOB|nr:D-2-hydroxyacid dehydrogenase family protein [Mameliella alba]KHQ51324.1 D-isomer specific 2-hydroxyacid dehydrogenase NAD-binding protein [Mameliella alba]
MTDLPICAILDDYQDAALACADWSALDGRINLRRYDAHLGDEDAVARALADCTVIVAMRERTPFPASLLRRLPRLKLLVTTGMRNRSIDLQAAADLGITVCGTGAAGNPAAELAWGGLLAFMRQLPEEVANFRAGGPWQTGLGRSLQHKRLGIVGLGKLGRQMARFGQAFGMEVCGWTRSDLEARAETLGIEPVDLPGLFASSDVITIQLSLVDGTRGLVSADLLGRMRPDAVLVNTSRGPIVDEAALIAALEGQRIGGAVLDVFDHEPLPADHAYRRLTNVLATPHIGYVTQENYRVYYREAVENVANWLEGRVLRALT